MTHPNAETLNRFYTAFANLDSATMASCYSDDAVMSDEVFSLTGKKEVVGMWSMLCDSIKDKGREVWKLEFSQIEANDVAGKAHWEAHYRFSATGRMVHNKIDGTFKFKNGLIIEHRDSFDFHAWSKQALGAPGLLLGWTGFLKNKVKSQAAMNLKKYIDRASK